MQGKSVNPRYKHLNGNQLQSRWIIPGEDNEKRKSYTNDIHSDKKILCSYIYGTVQETSVFTWTFY